MLRLRLMTAAILIAIFMSALFLLPEFYWEAVMLLVAGAGAWEWSALAGYTINARRAYATGMLLLGGLLLPLPFFAQELALQHQVQLWLIFIAAMFWLILAPVWLLKRQISKNAILMAAVGWLLLLSTWLALNGLRRVSPSLVLVLMSTVWIADSAAYFFGKRFGRRKLSPEISPGKTWEGVLGALLVVTLYGLALCLTLNLSWWVMVGLWGLTILSIVGDLFESLLKRQARGQG